MSAVSVNVPSGLEARRRRGVRYTVVALVVLVVVFYAGFIWLAARHT